MFDPALLPPRPSEPIIFVNGKFLPESQAKLSVLDHGLMYGDGVFDALTGRNGFIFQFVPHLDRLYRSMHYIKLNRWMKTPKEEMGRWIVESIRRNAITDFYVKVLVTRGVSPEPVIDPTQCPEASVVIYVRHASFAAPSEKDDKGIRIKVLSIRRVPHDSLDPKIKSLNYLNIVMGKLEAWDSGFDDAVMLDKEGYVCECPGYNIIGISGNKLFTPSHGILSGITRATVMEIARELGLEVEEGFYSVYDFAEADEVFMTNTHAGLNPVIDIDGWTIGDGKVGKLTRSIRERYWNWLATGKYGTQVYPEAWKRP